MNKIIVRNLKEIDTSPFENIRVGYAKIAFRKNLPEFYRQLHGALEGGKGASETLSDMATQAKLRGNDVYLIYNRILFLLEAGEPLYRALAPYVTSVDVTLLKPSASNERALLRALAVARLVAESRERMQRLGSSKLLGPLWTFLGVSAMSVYMAGNIFPEIMTGMGGGTGRGVNGLLDSMVAVSTFIIENRVNMAIVIASIIVFGMITKSRIPNSRIRRFLDKIPPWSFHQIKSGGNFVVSLSALIETGSSPKESFASISESADAYLKSHLVEMESRIGAGAQLSYALETGLLPDKLVDEIAIRGRPESIQYVLRQLGMERLEDLEFLMTKSINKWAFGIQAASYAIGFLTTLGFAQLYGIAGSVSVN